MARTMTKEIAPDPDEGATPPVLLAQLAARIQRDSTSLESELNGEKGVDWAGRPIVSATLAREMVAAYDEQRDRLARLRAEFDDHATEYGACREGFYRRLYVAAFEAARETSEKHSRSTGIRQDDVSHRIASKGPQTRQAAQGAARRLLREWDESNPLLDRGEFERLEGNVELPPDVPKAADIKRVERDAVDAYLSLAQASRFGSWRP